MPFNIGDRVRCLGEVGNSHSVNQIGTICECSMAEGDIPGSLSYGVCFDLDIGGHDCSGNCVHGRGWYCDSPNLVPTTISSSDETIKGMKALVIDCGQIYSEYKEMAEALGAVAWVSNLPIRVGEEIQILNSSDSLHTSHPALYNRGRTELGGRILLVKRISDGKELIINEKGIIKCFEPIVGKDYPAKELIWFLRVGMYVRWKDTAGTNEFYVGEIVETNVYLWTNDERFCGAVGRVSPKTKGFKFSIRVSMNASFNTSKKPTLCIIPTINPIYIDIENFKKEMERIKKYEPENIMETYLDLKQRWGALEQRMMDEFRIFSERWELLLGLKDWKTEFVCRDAVFSFVVSDVVNGLTERISKIKSLTLKSKVEAIEQGIY